MTLARQTHRSSLCTHSTGSMGALLLPLLVLSLYRQVSVSMSASCKMYGVIANCSFKNLTEVPILPSYTQHLYLENNRISVLDSGSLRGLRLDQNNTFLRQQRLKTLILGSNLRLRLEPRAFVGLSSLQELYLDYCNLTDSILSGNYLQPLRSLETLNLAYNEIVRVQPASFFSTLRNLKDLDLKLNPIDRMCEEDLIGFQGKVFTRFNLESNKLFESWSSPDFDWAQCGNPFRNMGFDYLFLSTNGFNTNSLQLFFKAIDGTSIASLHYSGALGRGFSFRNFPDPDRDTFAGLRNSSVRVLDLSRNYIFALQEAVFSPLTDAIIINVSSNKINQINRGAFEGVEGNLRMLNLSVLDLSYNHIGVLGYQAFRGLPSLKSLDLRGNSLRRLGTTASLPELLLLHLSDNRLSSLWGITELAGRGITYLTVEGNRLSFLDDLLAIVELFPHLVNLNFGGNFIKWCTSPRQASSGNHSLIVLDLHDSSLQIIWAQGWCLDIFHRFDKLHGLNLTYNSLTTLPQGIFNGLHSIIKIDLSSNDLTYLQPGTFPQTVHTLYLSNNFLATPNPDTFRHLAFINLAGNRFYCNCNLERFLWWMNSTNVTFLSPREELRCGFPLQLQNLPLHNYSTIIEPCEGDDERQRKISG
uniref:Toll like receptor 5 n=1 Tax=Neogobius melanostomus TaxID=47308 RepID=A0A8C6V3N5_9GOBI